MRPIDDPGQPPAKPHSLTCRSHEPNGFCTCSVGIMARPRPLFSADQPDPETVRRMVALVKRRFTEWRDPPVEMPADSVIRDVVLEIMRVGRGPLLTP